jgi:hypothetical protein
MPTWSFFIERGQRDLVSVERRATGDDRREHGVALHRRAWRTATRALAPVLEAAADRHTVSAATAMHGCDARVARSVLSPGSPYLVATTRHASRAHRRSREVRDR